MKKKKKKKKKLTKNINYDDTNTLECISDNT